MSICDQFCWRNLIVLCWTINKGSANQFWLGASTRQLSFPNVKHKILEIQPFCARGNILLTDFGPYPIPWICRWGNQGSTFWMQLKGHFLILKKNRRVSLKNRISQNINFHSWTYPLPASWEWWSTRYVLLSLGQKHNKVCFPEEKFSLIC